MSSGLYYHGTSDEVVLGDRVSLSRWFRSPRTGTVCYLPGISVPHPEMQEDEGLQNWAIELDDGTYLLWPYFPSRLQPTPRIRLIARGDAGYRGLDPTKVIGAIPDSD